MRRFVAEHVDRWGRSDDESRPSTEPSRLAEAKNRAKAMLMALNISREQLWKNE